MRHSMSPQEDQSGEGPCLAGCPLPSLRFLHSTKRSDATDFERMKCPRCGRKFVLGNGAIDCVHLLAWRAKFRDEIASLLAPKVFPIEN
jgi:hypothetical protein